MAKMQIDESTIDKAIELCNSVLGELSQLMKNVDVNFGYIGGGWKDEQYKNTRKVVDESLEKLNKSFDDVKKIYGGLQKTKAYIHDYDSPIT